MKRWAYNRTKLKSRQGSICPKVQNRLDKESWLTRYWIPRSVLISGPHCALSYFFSSLLVHNMFLLQIRWSADKLFEVRHISQLGEQFAVNIDKRDCTCRKWAISGMPCCHALTAMKFLNLNGEDFMSDWFRKTTYEETYNSIIYPINGQQAWERTPYPDVFPPKKRVMPGRPKKKRRLEAWEIKKDDTQLRKGGYKKRCTVCRGVGHNRTFCPHNT